MVGVFVDEVLDIGGHVKRGISNGRTLGLGDTLPEISDSSDELSVQSGVVDSGEESINIGGGGQERSDSGKVAESLGNSLSLVDRGSLLRDGGGVSLGASEVIEDDCVFLTLRFEGGHVSEEVYFTLDHLLLVDGQFSGRFKL